MPITNEARKDPKIAREVRMMSRLVLCIALPHSAGPLMAAAYASLLSVT